MSESSITDFCVKLVTKYGLPLKILDISPIRKFTDQVYSKLNMNPIYSRNIGMMLKIAEEK